MRRQTAFAFFVTTLLLCGCGDLLSLHGLYSSGGTLLEPALEGQWVNDTDRLTVSRESTVYQVSLQPLKNPSHESKFELRIVDINGTRFADIIPDEGFGHIFLRVQLSGGQLRVAFFDSDWLRQRIPHEDADETGGKKQAIWTARTPEVRKVVEKYASEPRAFGEEIVFRRP